VAPLADLATASWTFMLSGHVGAAKHCSFWASIGPLGAGHAALLFAVPGPSLELLATGGKGGFMSSRRQWAASPLRKPHPWLWISLSILTLIAGGSGVWANFHFYPNKKIEIIPGTTATVAMFIIVLYFSVRFYRRFRLDYLELKPGPVEVITFTDTRNNSENITGTPRFAEHVTWQFRESLAEVQLRSPWAIPGGSQASGFLEVTQKMAQSSTWRAALTHLFTGVFVTHAYQVNGQLFDADDGRTCGIEVQVIVLPCSDSPPIEVTDTTWEGAAHKAALSVGAFIMPRTRTCKTQYPWPGWQGLNIPAELFITVQRAQKLDAARRYDEALGEYFNALKFDPSNHYIRLAIGGVQEKMGLYLDALLTYFGIIHKYLDELPPTDMNKLWQGKLPGYRETRKEKAWSYPVLVARYRYVVLLTQGDSLARQWYEFDDRSKQSKRSRERAWLRERILKDILHEDRRSAFIKDIEDKEQPRPGTRGETWAKEFASSNPNKEAYESGYALLLQEFFQYVAKKEAEALLQSYARWHIRRWRSSQTPLTPAVLRMLSTSAVMRRVHTRFLRSHYGINPIEAPQVWPHPDSDDPLFTADITYCQWPPDGLAHRLDKEVLQPAMRFPKLWPRLYIDYYNAACLFSKPLIPDEVCAIPSRQIPSRKKNMEMDQQRRELVAAAIKYLDGMRRYIDSGLLANVRRWMLSEDSDLVGLRCTEDFREWVAEHLPSMYPYIGLPRNVRMLASTHYVIRIVSILANFWEERWREFEKQLCSGELTYEDAAVCRRDVEESRKELDDLALNYRHWQSRLEILNLLGQKREESLDYPIIENDPFYRRQRDADGLADQSKVDEQASKAIKKRNELIHSLSSLRSGNSNIYKRAPAVQAIYDTNVDFLSPGMKKFPHRTLSPYDRNRMIRIALDNIAAWKTLNEELGNVYDSRSQYR
jgi:hypothetical protein